MKQVSAVTFICAMLLVFTSLAQKKTGEEYEFPPAMDPEVKLEFIKQFNKGKILYNINCGKCHNRTVKGKVIVPDFTPEQVANYEIRMANPKHQADLIEDKILPEELGQITVYFTYRKRQPATR